MKQTLTVISLSLLCLSLILVVSGCSKKEPVQQETTQPAVEEQQGQAPGEVVPPASQPTEGAAIPPSEGAAPQGQSEATSGTGANTGSEATSQESASPKPSQPPVEEDTDFSGASHF
jgi:hypothetical protein